jgi:DNA-binding protein YbaB
MKKPKIDPDEMLESLAAEAVKQAGHVRAAIRDLTLQALQARELSLKQISTVVRRIAEGVNLGIADEKRNVEKTLSDAFAGMDEALLKVVEANQVALEKLTEGGASFEQSGIKKGLKELEAFEEEFLDGIKAATRKASKQAREQWTSILGNIQPGGTDSGARAAETLETYAQQAKTAMRSSRESSLKIMHTLTQNYATLVSGVLIGLSQALGQSKSKNNG